MSSILGNTSLQINGTQQISRINTTLNNNNVEIPTSKAVVTFLRNKGVQPFPPTLLNVSGSWAQSIQKIGDTPDISGLTFLASFSDGMTFPVTEISVRPVRWTTQGNQAATFYYTVGGTTVTATKTCHIIQNEIQLDSFQVDDTITSLEFVF